MFFGNAWACIGYAHRKMAVHCFGGHAHLAGVGELDRVADEVEEHLGQALLIAEADG